MEENGKKKIRFHYEDNLELLKKAKDGDDTALNVLVELNMPLVTNISKKFLNRGYDYDDIFQIGCIGLVKAIKNFNFEYNVKFSTYAVPMIIGEIKRFLRDDGMIKVSRSIKLAARKIQVAKDELSKKLGREPTVSEISDYAEMAAEEILDAIDSMNNIQYLYDVVHQDDGSPVLLIDRISENVTEDKEFIDKIALKEILNALDAKSRQIILLRYFKDKTQVQVAEMLGISQVQVSRIEKKVLRSLKNKLIG
ncbi:MAG: RNA polymerase sporulation sigma factor SigF [Oscillospiraceae bacterium]|nr:RNA polymerase sporulation sigma factor SigF [Oscillospiraceae bacterium]